jgi:hypothetical protein
MRSHPSVSFLARRSRWAKALSRSYRDRSLHSVMGVPPSSSTAAGPSTRSTSRRRSTAFLDASEGTCSPTGPSRNFTCRESTPGGGVRGGFLAEDGNICGAFAPGHGFLRSRGLLRPVRDRGLSALTASVQHSRRPRQRHHSRRCSEPCSSSRWAREWSWLGSIDILCGAGSHLRARSRSASCEPSTAFEFSTRYSGQAACSTGRRGDMSSPPSRHHPGRQHGAPNLTPVGVR